MPPKLPLNREPARKVRGVRRALPRVRQVGGGNNNTVVGNIDPNLPVSLTAIYKRSADYVAGCYAGSCWRGRYGP